MSLQRVQTGDRLVRTAVGAGRRPREQAARVVSRDRRGRRGRTAVRSAIRQADIHGYGGQPAAHVADQMQGVGRVQASGVGRETQRNRRRRRRVGRAKTACRRLRRRGENRATGRGADVQDRMGRRGAPAQHPRVLHVSEGPPAHGETGVFGRNGFVRRRRRVQDRDRIVEGNAIGSIGNLRLKTFFFQTTDKSVKD